MSEEALSKAPQAPAPAPAAPEAAPPAPLTPAAPDPAASEEPTEAQLRRNAMQALVPLKVDHYVEQEKKAAAAEAESAAEPEAEGEGDEEATATEEAKPDESTETEANEAPKETELQRLRRVASERRAQRPAQPPAPPPQPQQQPQPQAAPQPSQAELEQFRLWQRDPTAALLAQQQSPDQRRQFLENYTRQMSGTQPQPAAPDPRSVDDRVQAATTAAFEQFRAEQQAFYQAQEQAAVEQRFTTLSADAEKYPFLAAMTPSERVRMGHETANLYSRNEEPWTMEQLAQALNEDLQQRFSPLVQPAPGVPEGSGTEQASKAATSREVPDGPRSLSNQHESQTAAEGPDPYDDAALRREALRVLQAGEA